MGARHGNARCAWVIGQSIGGDGLERAPPPISSTRSVLNCCNNSGSNADWLRAATEVAAVAKHCLVPISVRGVRERFGPVLPPCGRTAVAAAPPAANSSSGNPAGSGRTTTLHQPAPPTPSADPRTNQVSSPGDNRPPAFSIANAL